MTRDHQVDKQHSWGRVRLGCANAFYYFVVGGIVIALATAVALVLVTGAKTVTGVL